MDNGAVENIFKNADMERTVQSVLSFEGKAVVEYISYRSTFYRLVFKVILGNGKTVKRSLILKEPLTDPKELENKNALHLFKIETMLNNSVLKEMEYLMDEVGDPNDILWCKLLHHESYSSLLFEDLEAKGFKHIKWNFTLDYDHCVLVLRNLGKFHGMCKVLEERGIIRKDDYESASHFFTDKNFINGFFSNGFQILRRGMFKYWGISWESVAERLNVPSDLIEKRLAEIGEMSETRFNVLNHGDCWINNVMFKYDLDNKPFTMRFLNFQRPLYNSPCLDITYFMYVCINPVMRRNNFERLLKAYYECLISTLENYSFKGIKPTFEEISADMDRVSFFGLSLFAVHHAVFSSNVIKVTDMEQLYEEKENGFNIEIYKNKSLIDEMIPDLIHFIQLAGI